MELGCQSGIQRDISLGNLFLDIVSLNPTPPGFPGGVNYDQPVSLAKPHKIIGCCGLKGGEAAINIYLHFVPTGFSNITGFITITPVGNEPWIPLQNGNNVPTSTPIMRLVKFTKPVQHFFISSDHPNGGSGPIAIFGIDNLDEIFAMRI